MKCILKKAAMAVSLVSLLSACTKETVKEVTIEKPVPVPSVSSVDAPMKDVTVVVDPATMSAEELALAGEQLITPTTFMYADGVFDVALSKDPQNLRARFYKSFLKQFMVFKGVSYRLESYRAKIDPGVEKKFAKERADIREESLRDFLYSKNAGSPFVKDTDIQDLMVSYREGVNSFRVFLRKELSNSNSQEFIINLNPYLMTPFISERESQYCSSRYIQHLAKNPDQKVFTCHLADSNKIKIAPADALVLSQYAAGWVLYLGLTTSHSWDGLGKLYRIQRHKKLTHSQGSEFLRQQENFGILRKDHRLGLMTELGSDLLAATKWVMANQTSLCPEGRAVSYQRYGHLFEQGICIEDEAKQKVNKDLSILEMALKGITGIEMDFAGDDKKVMAKVDAFAWARNPIQDIKTLIPTEYNACDEATEHPDPTMGGIFVDPEHKPIPKGKLPSSKCK